MKRIMHISKEMRDAIDSIHQPLLGIYENGNANVAIFADGTKITQTDESDFDYEFANNIDIKITDYCQHKCPFCFEGSTEEGKHGDLDHPILKTLKPYQEIAIGGGNPLKHSDLIPFLKQMKGQKVITNMTINQIDFMNEYEFIKELTDKKLIYGLGISMTNPTPEFIEKVKTIPTAIVHTIAGLFTQETMETLADNDLKILILGYKNLRRGSDFKNRYSQRIDKYIHELSSYINDYTDRFRLISFDNLAIRQLNMEEKCTEEEWKNSYMGDDGTQTFYIDLVKEEFATNSTSLSRYQIQKGMTVTEAFQIVKGQSYFEKINQL